MRHYLSKNDIDILRQVIDSKDLFLRILVKGKDLGEKIPLQNQVLSCRFDLA
tara:strand:+ start:952 stop:1107 length:156 start_codon:yes stop_codon:yes gene_type:complete